MEEEKRSRNAGRDFDPFDAFKHRPVLLKTLRTLRKECRLGTRELTDMEIELLAFRVSQLNGCAYCAVGHGLRLASLSRNKDLPAQLISGSREQSLTPRQMVLLEMAEQLTLRPGENHEHLVERLRKAGLSKEGVLDVVLVNSYFNFLNRMLQGSGQELPAHLQKVATRWGMK